MFILAFIFTHKLALSIIATLIVVAIIVMNTCIDY